MDLLGIDDEIWVTMLSALAGAFSFALFAYPFLQKSEKKQRYRDVIEKKRKVLYEEAKQSIEKKGDKNLSAKESVAMFFRVQKLAGEFGEKVRYQMLQAGIRNPMAPITYLLAQAFLPLFFVGFAVFVFLLDFLFAILLDVNPKTASL